MANVMCILAVDWICVVVLNCATLLIERKIILYIVLYKYTYNPFIVETRFYIIFY